MGPRADARASSAVPFVLLLLALPACGGDSTTGTDAGPGDDASTDARVPADAPADSPTPVDLGPDTASCADADGDGHAARACGGDDCDDTDPLAFPGNPEVCDGAGHDEDCDPATLGPDADMDTFVATTCCDRQPGGALLCGTDCDDTRATVNPSAVETCNGIDDNCNGVVDEGIVSSTFYPDCDGDMFGDLHATGMAITGCALPTTPPASCGGAASAEWSTNNTDCNDANMSIHPGASEVCDGLDDDCDGVGDAALYTTFNRDADADGYGNHLGGTMMACSAPVGYVADDTDCNDGNSAVHPGATEICNGLDDNCNGLLDESLHGSCMAGVGACRTTGSLRCDGSCTATPGTPDATFHTSAAPNGSFDWNCDGTLEPDHATDHVNDGPPSTPASCSSLDPTNCNYACAFGDIYDLASPGSVPSPYCGAALLESVACCPSAPSVCTLTVYPASGAIGCR